MQVNSQVQEIWLRLLGAADSSQTPRIERVEEGYYAVVHEAAIWQNAMFHPSMRFSGG